MRKPYRTDLTDAQWKFLKPLIPPAKPGGRPREVDMREVLNTLLYQNRTGCQWDLLPHDLLPKSTVYDYFAAWRDDGTWQRMLDALRPKVREAAGRDRRRGPAPSTARRSRRPRSAASGAMTGPRRSPGGSGTWSWTPWGCCWRSWSRRPRPTTGRRHRGCWGNCGGGIPAAGGGLGDHKYRNRALDAWLERTKAPFRVEVVSRPRIEGVRGCPSVGWRSGPSPGWAVTGGTARTTSGGRSRARRGSGSVRSARCCKRLRPDRSREAESI